MAAQLPKVFVCIWCEDGLKSSGHGYLTCSGCGAEYIPPDPTTEAMVKKTVHAVLPCARSSEVSSGLMHIKGNGGGSKKSRKRSNSYLKKPSCSTLFGRLFQQT
jgi:hypothetical protein